MDVFYGVRKPKYASFYLPVWAIIQLIFYFFLFFW